MDEQIINRQKEVLNKLLTNPADNGAAYATNLLELVRAYPQSGLFHALFSRAIGEANPAKAAAHFDGRALHKLVNYNENLQTVNKAQVIIQKDSLNGQAATEPIPEKNDSAIFTDKPVSLDDALDISWLNTAKEEDKPKQEAQPAGEVSEVPVQETTNSAEDITNRAPWELDEEPEQADEPLGHAPWETEEQFEDEERSHTRPAEPIAEAPADNADWENNYQPEYETPQQPEQIADIPEEQTQAWQHFNAEEPAPENNIPAEQLWQGESNYESNPGYSHIEEEVYDEITGIDDIELTQYPQDTSDEPVAEDESLIELENGPIEHLYDQPYQYETPYNEPQHQADETNYFVFDQAYNESNTETGFDSAHQPQYDVPHTGGQEHIHQNDISKYHDEKMPYTFMWWLDKTRKEHGSLYQPYVKGPANDAYQTAAQTPPSPKKPVTDELQQQYFENIFNLSSVDEYGNETDPNAINFDTGKKEDRIIQRFITEDPQIHPPVGEKLDTENKAKRSSEDSDIMVTETLARIYADQMLYPKAIATYKKLMLKYPEKSRYFASRIENLEKKTN